MALLVSAGAQSKIAVMDVAVRAGVPSSVGPALSEDVVAEVRRHRPLATVISADEIRELVAVEGQKQKVGCRDAADVACLAEIGGALGAERMVIGSLGRLGRTYVFSLKLVDVAHAKILTSATTNLTTRDDGELLDSAARLVGQLLPPEHQDQPLALPLRATVDESSTREAPSRPGSHSHLLGLLLGVGGLACGAAAIFGLTRVLAFNEDAAAISVNTGHLDFGKVQADRRSAQLWQPLGLGLTALAAVGLTSAVIVW